MCGEEHGSFKSYMDYKLITSTTSDQYKLIYSDEIVVGDDGLLYSGEYIGVALGSRFAGIGSKFIVTLDDGKQVKIIKLDEKSDRHTINKCHHSSDSSVIEFVVDSEKCKELYPMAMKMGDFNWIEKFSGKIMKIELVREVGE